MGCVYCNYTGKHEKPDNEEMFDERFEHYDKMGIFDTDTCSKKALSDVGYTIVDCPLCSGK